MIYPDICTVWLKSTEERKATWERVIYRKCRLEPTYGADSGTDGDTSLRSADLLIKCHEQPLNKGDKVLGGLHVAEVPPKEALTVQTVVPVSFGAYPDHWEMTLS